MLTKYTLVHIPDRGVDRLLNGQRIQIDQTLSDEKADQLFALGCRYLQPVIQTQTAELSADTHANQKSSDRKTGRNRSANGRFTKQQ